MTFSFNVGGLTPQDAQNQGGGGGTTVIETLSPKNIAGLCFWLDGQCNTRQGNDHSKKYMENLVWNVPDIMSNSNREVFPADTTKNTWKNDFLKYETYAYYPLMTSEQISLEMVFYLDDDFQTYANPYRNGSGGPFNFILIRDVSEKGKLQFSYGSAGNTTNTYEKDIEKNNIYYFCGTCKNTTLTYFLNGFNIANEGGIYQRLITNSSAFAGIGLGATESATPTANRWEGLNIAMLRCWSRALTDSEIQQNYEDAKKRFKF